MPSLGCSFPFHLWYKGQNMICNIGVLGMYFKFIRRISIIEKLISFALIVPKFEWSTWLCYTAQWNPVHRRLKLLVRRMRRRWKRKEAGVVANTRTGRSGRGWRIFAASHPKMSITKNPRFLYSDTPPPAPYGKAADDTTRYGTDRTVAYIFIYAIPIP